MNQTILPIKLKKTEEKITAQSGLIIIGEALKAYGIEEGLKTSLPKPRSNRGNSGSAYIIPTLLSMAGGGRTMEDVQKLFSDRVLCESLKLTRFDASTQSKWLRAKGEEMNPKVRRLDEKQVEKALLKSGFTTFTADVDAMMIESEKSTAQKTYKGFHGYNTLLGFFAETQHCGYQAFRTGNTSPANGVLKALKEMRSLCPKGTDITHFRSDSAGWSTEVLEYCEDTGVTFSVTADMNSATRGVIANIPESEWKTLYDKEGRQTDREVAETIYCFGKGLNSHRLIVQRSSSRQLDLFSEGRQHHYAISTNSTLSPQEVVFFHNGRAKAENNNKELKYSLNLEYLPTNDFNANKLWFTMGVLVYNLMQSIKQQLLPQSWRHKKIETLRWQLIHVAGHLVYHARQYVLKIASVSEEIFEVMQLLRDNLCRT
jgi:hypothetical protein